jgi:hypothetical protein
VDALGAAGQDQRGRLAGGDVGGRRAVRDDLGVHVQLAHAPGDQLGVLGAEVDHQHGVLVLGTAGGGIVRGGMGRGARDVGQD